MKRNRSELIDIFEKKWVEYARAINDWVLAHRKLNIPCDLKYHYLQGHLDKKQFYKFKKILQKHHVTWPDEWKLYREVTKASHPILNLLFTPNEQPNIPIILSYHDSAPGDYEKWSDEYKKIYLNVYNRLEAARNRLAFDEQKEQNDGVNEDVPPLTKKEEPDYLKYRYRGWDILSFLNEKAGHSSFYIQVNGRQKQKIENSPFLLLLFLAIKLKENKGGWVEIDRADEVDVTDSYNIKNVEDLVYRLRDRIGPHLRTVSREDFIEVEGRKVRLSTHPSRIEVFQIEGSHKKWLKNTFEEVKNSLLGKRAHRKVQRRVQRSYQIS